MRRFLFALSVAHFGFLALGEEACESHPGGCRCYYDAMADGCPGAIPQGGMLALCSCDYRSNSWLRVFTHFLRFFEASDYVSRESMVKASVFRHDNGVLSAEVGHKERLQCSPGHTTAWPGTLSKLDFHEIGKMANSIFFPQVQQTLMDLCAPGRFLMGVLCLHASLHFGDAVTASAYAESMLELYERIGSCLEGNTPFPKQLDQLYPYLKGWRQAQFPSNEDPSAISAATVQRLAWWPKDLHAKEPGAPGMNLWPCVPMKDPHCFPPGAEYQQQSCEFCCDPVHGSQGAPGCFDAIWTFGRCCQTPGDRGYY